MSRDPELPNGYQDDDFDMRELEQAGALTAALRRRGICDHGWLMAPNGEPARCLHCGAVFANAEAAYEARREVQA
jgi:hypothetical protein